MAMAHGFVPHLQVWDHGVEQVQRWTVWFQTPIGVYRTIREAYAAMDRADFLYDVIEPVAVAESEHGYAVSPRISDATDILRGIAA